MYPPPNSANFPVDIRSSIRNRAGAFTAVLERRCLKEGVRAWATEVAHNATGGSLKTLIKKQPLKRAAFKGDPNKNRNLPDGHFVDMLFAQWQNESSSRRLECSSSSALPSTGFGVVHQHRNKQAPNYCALPKLPLTMPRWIFEVLA